MKKLMALLLMGAACLGVAAARPAAAEDADAALKASFAKVAELARKPIDTSRFKKAPPYHVGLSAGYLGNSWILFAAQYIKYEVSLHPEFADLVVTDAGFNPAKQTADIEDLISKGVDLLLFWPVDEKAVLPALQKAADKGIATVNVGYNFMDSPSVAGNAYVDQWEQSTLIAQHLCEDLQGKGKIFAMLPIAGSSAAVTQLAALKDTLKQYPGIELLSVEYGDWNRAKAKQLTENVLQRFAKIDGVFSPAGQMSAGVLEAFEEAGRAEEVTMSPGDEYNGWVKRIAQSQKWGSVTSGLEVGRAAVQHGLAILEGGAVANAEIVPVHYMTAAEAAKLYQPDRPDDWWPSSLPPDWLPK